MNPTEQDIRTLIDIQLSNLGWIFEGNQKNVFQESPKFSEEKNKLDTLRPDYILYNGDLPIAIVEAKRPNGNFDLAKQDGLKKAEKLVCKIIFVSDSSYTRCYKIGIEKEIYKNNHVVDTFLDLKTLIKCENSTSGNVNDEAVIQTHKELIIIFQKADDILRQCGIQQGFPRLIEFCNLLFIKLLSDINSNDSYNWDVLVGRTGDDLTNTYENIINHYNEIYVNILKAPHNQINSEVLRRLVLHINHLGDLSQIDIDLKGEAFEYFLKKYQDSHSDLAQYFTPRHIIKFMVGLMKPQTVHTILDPFCGTGGMLIECFKYIKKNNKLTTSQANKLKYKTIYGQDNSDSCKIAKMNMILAGDGHSNISQKDTLKAIPQPIYDYVITNIPFNLKPNPVANNMKCVDFCLNSLKETGKAFVIVPYSMVITENKKYHAFRKNMEALIKLPSGVFLPYTTAKCFILVLAKNKTSDKIQYLEIQNDGFSKDKLREPTRENDLELFKKGLKKLNFISDFSEIEQEHKTHYKNYKLLKEFLEEQNNYIKIKDDEIYFEPNILSINNIIKTRRKRLGKNIKGKTKKLIKKGNLVISTLHTQNGLFAIADKNYIANSQLVYNLKEGVDKDFLFFLLNKEIRKLSKDDIVGRETYKKDEIEDIKIPVLNEQQEKELKNLFQKQKELQKNLKDTEDKIKNYKIL